MRRPSDLRIETDEGMWRGASRVATGWGERFIEGPQDHEALLVLSSLGSLTARRLQELANTYHTAATCLAAVREGVGVSPRDGEIARALEPAAIQERLGAAGARLVTLGDVEYPPGLLDLADPPCALFLLGRPLSELEPRVAIVGARNCSSSGREVASSLARAVAAAGACVVSGGARGIDTAAHRGSLDAGGGTVAVLGSGIDVRYPATNRSLFDAVARAGALVSEYPPGAPPEPFRFPARNRIVAALSSAVVVVEGAEGSGSMITADHALDIGRDVFAVPGAVTSALAEVPLALIREGAGLIRGPEDLLADLGLAMKETGLEPAADGTPGPEATVWQALSSPQPPDRLAAGSGLSLPEVMAALTGLELRGAVRSVGGRYERRLHRKNG
jgi:DNA processing protein